MRAQDAHVILAMADILADLGQHDRLVVLGRRIAERIEGPPRSDDDLAARRGRAKRFRAKALQRAGSARGCEMG